MASSTPKTIILRGSPQRAEAPANGAITPGELLDFASDGDVQPGGSETTRPTGMVAVENPFADDNTVASIDHDYATGETTRYAICNAGDRFYGWLAAGENVAIGAELVADGNGELQARGTFDGYAVWGVATEAVNNSAGTVPARITVQMI